MNPRYKNPGNKEKRYSQCPQDADIFEIHQTTKERCKPHPVSFRHFLIGEVTALNQTSPQRKSGIMATDLQGLSSYIFFLQLEHASPFLEHI